MSGRFQDALTAYNAVIERYPASNTLPDTYYKRGMALNALGQLPQARESLDFVDQDVPVQRRGLPGQTGAGPAQRAEEVTAAPAAVAG